MNDSLTKSSREERRSFLGKLFGISFGSIMLGSFGGVFAKGKKNEVVDLFPVGAICVFGGKVPPFGWALCHGQDLSISEYPELFRQIGTIYGGGEGKVKLPDMRGAIPVCAGGKLAVGECMKCKGNPSKVAFNRIPSYNHLSGGEQKEGQEFIGMNYIIKTGLPAEG